MADNSTPLVYVEKDGDLRTHFSKPKEITWTSGKVTTEQVPSCGTRVDVTALYAYRGYAHEVTCGRCARHPRTPDGAIEFPEDN